MQQLNAILMPDDGVICTGCNGVYLVGGRPYEFAFWWNDIHHIHDVASFDDFCRRNGIRYWIVNHSRSMAGRRSSGIGTIAAKYWTDARTGGGVGHGGGLRRGREAPPIVGASPRNASGRPSSKSGQALEPSDARAHWVNLAKRRRDSPAKDAIAVTGRAWIGHRLEPEIPGGLCRVNLDLWSSEPTDPLMEITWYDAERQAHQPHQRRRQRQSRTTKHGFTRRCRRTPRTAGSICGSGSRSRSI